MEGGEEDEALLVAAGGYMTAFDGTPLQYGEHATHKKGLCAWTPSAKGRLDSALKDWLIRFPDGPPFKRKN